MKTINVSEETYEAIKNQLSVSEVAEIDNLSDLVGRSFFFRTVTYHLIGRVEKIIGNIVELSTASWVADSGRFMQAIKEGTLSEVEPVGRAFLNFSSVTDFFPWSHPLPITQK